MLSLVLGLVIVKYVLLCLVISGGRKCVFCVLLLNICIGFSLKMFM